MTIDWSIYSLEELRQHASTTFRQGGGSRPDVLLIEIGGDCAVLKDQSRADRLFALLVGPILNWRECKALTRLQLYSASPKLLHKPSSRSFLMSYISSKQITRVDKETVDWIDFFSKLESVINELHAAGVAHNDLRNPSNILITDLGEPVLVDLVAAWHQGQRWNFLNQWIFNKFCQVDRSAITKLKKRVAPDLLNEDDVEAEEIAGGFGMAIRGAGQLVRKISRSLFTKKS